MRLSIVVPAFNEEANLERFLSRLLTVLEDLPEKEIIFVDDGSRDGTKELLKKLSAQNACVQFVSLTRNFGHQTALRAGLNHAIGDAVLSMDADLQHPPELIPEMLEEWQNGTPVVNAVREKETGSLFKRVTSGLFYRFVNSISDYTIEQGSSDFRLLDAKVVAVIRDLPEHGIFLRGLIPWLGFKQANIPYQPGERGAGVSKYSLKKMVQLGLTGITSSSFKPLHLSTFIGITTSILALLYACYALFVKFVVGDAISGWTSLLISFMLIGGVQLTMLGIIGEYLGRILLEVKGRPDYLIGDSSLTKKKLTKK